MIGNIVIVDQMDHNLAFFMDRSSVGVDVLTVLLEDEEHPPSSGRTSPYALNKMILHAWLRKA